MKSISVKLFIVCVSLILVGLVLINVSDAKIDPDTLIGLWLFDEGKGDIAKDSSKNGRDGTLIKGPKWVDGKFGKALEFGGPLGQHVLTKNVPIPATGWSISSWISRDTNADYAIWINHNNVRKDGATLHLMFLPGTNTPRMCYHGDGDGFPLLSEVGKNVWTHIVFVIDPGGNRKVYLNGELDNSDKNTVGYNGGDVPLLIGMFLDCCQFVGLVDDVGVFDVALTQDDVVNIMNNGLGKAIGLLPVSSEGQLTTVWGEIKTSR